MRGKRRTVRSASSRTLCVAIHPIRGRGSAPLRPADAAIAGLGYSEARERAVRAFEEAFLRSALERHGGNVSATARSLGLHRQSLQKMLRRLGIAT